MNSYGYMLRFSNSLRWKQILRKIMLSLNHKQIEELEDKLPENLKFIGTALQETFTGNTSSYELEWLDSIEHLRNCLFESRERLQVKDYGSGSWILNRKSQNDKCYRVVQKSVELMCWFSAKPPIWCFFLMKLLRHFRPRVCVELGTNLGLSALYMAAAMKLNGFGKLYTIEGSPEIASLASEHFRALGLDNVEISVGSFHERLPIVLSNAEKIDFAFIDGHHYGKATLRYFHQIKRNLNSRALLAFDDINWSCGMRKTWQKIKNENSLCLSLDMFTLGICVFDSRQHSKWNMNIPLI